MSESCDVNEVRESDDQVYSALELECLNKDHPSDLLPIKLSEIVYRQCQKERDRKKLKTIAKAWTLIVSSLFVALMISLIVSKYLEDKHRNPTEAFLQNNITRSSLQNSFNLKNDISNVTPETNTEKTNGILSTLTAAIGLDKRESRGLQSSRTENIHTSIFD